MDLTDFTEEEREIIDRHGNKEPEDYLQQGRCNCEPSDDNKHIVWHIDANGLYVTYEGARRAIILTKYRAIRDWEKRIKHLRIIEIMMFVAMAVNLMCAFIHFLR